jgi:mono/diheme cytochrome c family protein
MKYTKSPLILLPLMTVAILILSFSYQQGQGPRMTVFVAPASAKALQNPVKGDDAATQAGQKLYMQVCAPCHGTRGRGDGPAAAALTHAPANHTADQVQDLSDGALFWMITNGNNPMPAYNKTMTETQRWQLVNFIRTLARKH